MTIPKPFDSGPVAVRTSRDVIHCVGPDTEDFLQGQLSQDVAQLSQGESAWSLLLQPQGKVDGWLRVTRLGDDAFLLDTDTATGQAALARLNRFKLRTQCEMVLEQWQMVSVRGQGSSELKPLVATDDEVVVPAGWPGIDGVDMLGPEVSPPAGLAEATTDDLENLRIMAGVPVMGAELTEATIPAEAGIVERSVSFTKGCFTGQELVARIDSRGGNVPRRLRGVRSSSALDVGQPVLVDGAEVGTVTSASGSVGLAYIKRSVESLPAEAAVDGKAVTIEELPLF